MSNQNVNLSLDVQGFINEKPFSGFQKMVFFLCFMIVLLDGFDTAAIGYIAPSLLKEWGLTKAALAPVLSAALFGLAAGALLSGPIADRIGRKMMLIASVTIFGIGCLCSAFSPDLMTLTILRFITGIGLGAAMPNAVTMISEFSPDQRRSVITNAMFTGFPLGAACGGFLAAWIIPQFGWRTVLLVGGITPLVLLIGLIFFMPESIRFMVSRQANATKILSVLRKISSDVIDAGSFYMTEVKKNVNNKSSLGVVLSKQYRLGSLMLWISYFMGLVIFYALINWMPILFKDAGLAPRNATLISALFPLGGVGAIVFGLLMDRFNANKVIAIGYLLTALSVCAIGQMAGNVFGLVVVVFLAGAIMNTSQSSLPALAAAYYPTMGRATGVSWMLGIGRFGGIAGSYLVALLASQAFTFSEIFAIVAIPGLIASAALFIKRAADYRD
jgi:AAHS family 4-hydroxybenzoate transporter-like MFS transporter